MAYQPYKNVEAFLLRDFKGAKKLVSVSLNLSCIEFLKEARSIRVNSANCITCNACTALCPDSRISFTQSLKAMPSCSATPKRSEQEIQILIDQIARLHSERLGSGHGNYASFEDFTSVKETTNIAVWGAAILRLILGSEAEISLEIPLTIQGRDRDGRLDICAITDSLLIVAECKISLKKMLSEGRYVAQMLAYEEELSSLGILSRFNLNAYRFLLIGGDETDLLPPDHPLCTGKAGNLSEVFYESVIKHGIKFISARGLLSVSIQKLVNPKLEFSDLLKNFDEENVLGVLAGKLVSVDKGKVLVTDYLD